MILGKRRPQHAPTIPMSAMIDIVFLLLIYFIVTQKDEISEAHLAVNLPSPNPPAEEPRENPNLLEIEIRPGKLFLKKRPRTRAQLREMLATFAALDTDYTVIVKTSILAQTRELVDVLDMCKELGLNQLNVMTLKN